MEKSRNRVSDLSQKFSRYGRQRNRRFSWNSAKSAMFCGLEEQPCMVCSKFFCAGQWHLWYFRGSRNCTVIQNYGRFSCFPASAAWHGTCLLLIALYLRWACMVSKGSGKLRYPIPRILYLGWSGDGREPNGWSSCYGWSAWEWDEIPQL